MRRESITFGGLSSEGSEASRTSTLAGCERYRRKLRQWQLSEDAKRRLCWFRGERRGRGRKRRFTLVIFRLDVIVEQSLEGRRQLVVISFQRGEMLAVDVNRAARRLSSTGQADSDVGGFRFAGAVDDAAHDGQLQLFHTFVMALPIRHFVANVALNAFRQLLERGARGTAAARASCNAGCEGSQSKRLQQFASGIHFLATIAARAWCQRDADCIANSFAEENSHGSRGPHQTLRSHARFREPQVQRLVCFLRELAINFHQIVRARNLAGNNNLVLAQTALESQLGGL